MIAISINFPSGRFHATPWGRHVNEAAPEWPPSPWRILRAFVATWKRKLNDEAGCDSHIMESLIRKLADPPMFVLPRASASHTRHFMPWSKKGPPDRTLIFDGFVALDKMQPLVCLWSDVVLDPQERHALNMIVSHIGFLGRAESWIEAQVLTDIEVSVVADKVNCMPLTGGYDRTKFDTVRVLCAHPHAAFENEYILPPPLTEGRGKAKQIIETPLYDPDWHLCMETLELHNKRWSDPPGSKWVTYLRRKDCFAPQTRRQKTTTDRPRPTMARFALDGNVLPLVEDTLKIAESARRAAMGKFSDIEKKRLYQGNPPENAPQPYSEVLSGKDVNGTPLEGHRHAYFLPTDEDGDGRIDHLTIIATMGFGLSEVKTLDLMRRLKGDQGEPLNLLLLALGQASEIKAPSIFGPSRVWISYTPFITTRYPKARGQKRDPRELLGLDNHKAFAQQVLKEEIQRLRMHQPDIPDPIHIEPINDEHRCGPKQNLRPIQFKRYRQKRSDDGGRRPAGAFRITFPKPVFGPLCLGHSSHFGLGLFVPEEETTP